MIKSLLLVILGSCKLLIVSDLWLWHPKMRRPIAHLWPVIYVSQTILFLSLFYKKVYDDTEHPLSSPGQGHHLEILLFPLALPPLPAKGHTLSHVKDVDASLFKGLYFASHLALFFRRKNYKHIPIPRNTPFSNLSDTIWLLCTKIGLRKTEPDNHKSLTKRWFCRSSWPSAKASLLDFHDCNCHVQDYKKTGGLSHYMGLLLFPFLHIDQS